MVLSNYSNVGPKLSWKLNLFGKVIEILHECFESWQAIPSQFMSKPKENHGKQIEISTGSWWSWNPAGSEIQLKVLRKLKEDSLAKWFKFLPVALKVGRRFPHNSYENQRKTIGNTLKSQQHPGEVGILLGPWNSIESIKKTEENLFGKVIEIPEDCFESRQAIPSQFIIKPRENHRKQTEISTGSWWSWNPADSEIELKVLRKLKKTSLAKWLKFLRIALKVGRRVFTIHKKT
jgi:ribulose bisphosphate carboxylase small subunit